MFIFLQVVMLDLQYSILSLATLSAPCTGRLPLSLSLSLSMSLSLFLSIPLSLPLRDSLSRNRNVYTMDTAVLRLCRLFEITATYMVDNSINHASELRLPKPSLSTVHSSSSSSSCLPEQPHRVRSRSPRGTRRCACACSTSSDQAPSLSCWKGVTGQAVTKDTRTTLLFLLFLFLLLPLLLLLLTIRPLPNPAAPPHTLLFFPADVCCSTSHFATIKASPSELLLLVDGSLFFSLLLILLLLSFSLSIRASPSALLSLVDGGVNNISPLSCTWALRALFGASRRIHYVHEAWAD